jgi:hypothetical protein
MACVGWHADICLLSAIANQQEIAFAIACLDRAMAHVWTSSWFGISKD